jgi:CheY-like chemotaxis protein
MNDAGERTGSMAKRILVADDEPMTAEMLSAMLAYRGYDVVCAYDGSEALTRARELRPDAVLLDVYMPGLEGVAVTQRLRADPALSSCPIVLISSADESDVGWREAGADLFLQKPVDLRRLPDVVDGLLAETEPPVLDGLPAELEAPPMDDLLAELERSVDGLPAA